MKGEHPLYALIIDWPEIGAFQKALDDGFLAACRERGAEGLIIGLGGLRIPDPSDAALDLALSLVEASRIDGFVAGLVPLSSFPDHAEIADLLEARLKRPAVRAGTRGGSGPTMSARQEAAFADLLDHLIEFHGYTSFAFVAGPPSNSDSEARLAVYRAALARAGLPFREEAVVYGGFQAMGGARAVAELLDERGVIPRAIVCANDLMAAGVVKELLSRGIGVPREIAVTGFDDIFEGGHPSIPFTTVKVDICDFTTKALFALDDIVRGLPARDYGEVECVFTRRVSCGCAPDERFEPVGGFAASNAEVVMEESFAIDAAIADWCNAIVAGRGVGAGDARLAVVARLMGIDRLRVTLLSDPGNYAGSGFVLAAGVEKGSPIALPPGGIPYAARDLMPPFFSLAPGEVVIVNFLVADGVMFGTLHCSSGTRGRHALEGIRGRLSSALHTLWTLRRLEAAERDVKAALDRVEGLSVSDELTGLLNRRGFMAVAGQQLGFLKRGSSRAFAFSFDLDGLAAINDRFGRAEGDWAIAAAARVLRHTLRECDVVARLGGDEFAVLCASEEPDGASRIASRVGEACAALNASSGKPFEVRLSAGWAPVPSEGSYIPLDDLLLAADRMLSGVRRSRGGE